MIAADGVPLAATSGCCSLRNSADASTPAFFPASTSGARRLQSESGRGRTHMNAVTTFKTPDLAASRATGSIKSSAPSCRSWWPIALAAVGGILMVLHGEPAQAMSWVGIGDSDSKPCTLASSCGSLQRAHDQTHSPGPVRALRSIRPPGATTLPSGSEPSGVGF